MLPKTTNHNSTPQTITTHQKRCRTILKTIISTILLLTALYILLSPYPTTTTTSATLSLNIRNPKIQNNPTTTFQTNKTPPTTASNNTSSTPMQTNDETTTTTTTSTTSTTTTTTSTTTTVAPITTPNEPDDTTPQYLTCNELHLKPTIPSTCQIQGQLNNTIDVSSKTNNDVIKFLDTISFNTNNNPLFVTPTNTPLYNQALHNYTTALLITTTYCTLYETYFSILGLNGLHKPYNPDLHTLGGWAAGYCRSKNINIKHAIDILASPASAGAALHGVVWTHLVAWNEKGKETSNTISTQKSDEELWTYILQQVCYMHDKHPQLYIHCLHAIGHAAIVMSAFDADPTMKPLLSYQCPSAPVIPQTIAKQTEIGAVRICNYANHYKSRSSSIHRRQQESFVCSDGLYMFYFQHSVFEKQSDTAAIPVIDTDLHINWWEPCGLHSQFAAPCFEFLFRTGVAGRRIAQFPSISKEASEKERSIEIAKMRSILYPTLCLRSEDRLREYVNHAFLSETQMMLACIHAISEHLYELEFPTNGGIGFLDQCNGQEVETFVEDTVEQRDDEWRDNIGFPYQPIFSFCAQSVLNIGFDKLLKLKQPLFHSALETVADKKKRLKHIAHVSNALVKRNMLSSEKKRWKACVSGIGTCASFYTSEAFIPCWSMKWTMCRDVVPRNYNGKSGVLGEIAQELVNLCLKLSLSRSARVDGDGDAFTIWDLDSLGFESQSLLPNSNSNEPLTASNNAFTWLVANAGPTAWRPGTTGLRFYADTACTKEIALKEDMISCSGSMSLYGGTSNCKDVLPSTNKPWRPDCVDVPDSSKKCGYISAWARKNCCDVQKAWIKVTFQVPTTVACIDAYSNDGNGLGAGKIPDHAWSGGILVMISNGDEENENKNNPDNILRGKYEYAKSNKWVFDETSG